MADDLMCPLLATAAQMTWQHRADNGVADSGDCEPTCLGSRCALWTARGCVLQSIAFSLAVLAKVET